jgi:cobalamin 5'-phosphate synthase/cobalamin synthase
VKRLVTALAFLTRAPLPSGLTVDAKGMGQSSMMFPLVGALLGCLSVGTRHALLGHVPDTVCAVLVVIVAALATGGLHLDALCDMADGFGGGRTREDILRIMRDHAIGSYGATALVLLLLLKVTALTALLPSSRADLVLIVAPTLARFSPLPLAKALPYARPEGGLGAAFGDHVGWPELVVGAALSFVLAILLLGVTGAVLCGATLVWTGLHGWLCYRRLGGMTGDTLGASTETCETLVLVLAIALP